MAVNPQLERDEILNYLVGRRISLSLAYKYLRRFSCRICIFMSLNDLRQVKKYDAVLP